MAITHKTGNATLEVNGRIDSAVAGAVNTGNHGNATTSNSKYGLKGTEDHISKITFS